MQPHINDWTDFLFTVVPLLLIVAAVAYGIGESRGRIHAERERRRG